MTIQLGEGHFGRLLGLEPSITCEFESHHLDQLLEIGYQIPEGPPYGPDSLNVKHRRFYSWARSSMAMHLALNQTYVGSIPTGFTK